LSSRLGTELEYSVFFMPRRTMVCEKVFQEEGIAADVILSEYPLDFIPFDSDILSLELDGAYKVDGDPTAFLSAMTVKSTVDFDSSWLVL